MWTSTPLALLVAAAPPALAAPDGGALDGWRAVARDCQPPPGRTAAGLVEEAVGFLGSPDPAWRDDVGYGVVERCVYRQGRLTAEERAQVVARVLPMLSDPDSVFRRSFAALVLSVFAAVESRGEPALTEATFHRLVSQGLALLEGETDLRGLDARQGWVHVTAHAADLLKHLARDPRFTAAEAGRLLDVTWSRLTSPGTGVFTAAEDERLAAAVLSVVRRDDFAAARLEPWLGRFVALEQRTWAGPRVDPAALAAAQNARNLLSRLWVALSYPLPGGAAPSAEEVKARAAVLRTLIAIRRA